MKGNFRAVAVAIACAFLSGCATESVRVTPARPVHVPIGELQLTGIDLESLYTYTESLTEIESVILASASRSGIAITPQGASNSLKAGGASSTSGSAAISFFIREQSYTKGFRATLSLAIIAEIRDGAGNIILRAEYFHDGDESFDSIGFLTSSLDATFKEIARATRKAG